MKPKIILLLILACCFQLAKAQDKVFKKDGTVVEVKAVEQTFSVLKYRMPDYSDGPVLWMPLSKIKKIEYHNGVIDMLGSLNPRMNKPFSVSLDLILLEQGGVVPTLGAGYFISPQLEFAGQFFTDFRETFYFVVGPKLYLTSNYSKKLASPFVGFLIGNDSGMAIAKMPIGVNLAGNKGLNMSLSFNLFQYLGQDTRSLSSLELGIGWRF